MKKAVKELVVAGVVLCVAGGILYGAGVMNGGRDYVLASGVEMGERQQKEKGIRTYQQEKTELEDISGINADLEHVDFMVKPSEDYNYYLEYTIDSRTEKSPLTAEIKDSVLYLQESEAEGTTYYEHVNIGFLDKMLGMDEKVEYTSVVTLYVPVERELMECVFELGGGDLGIRGLHTVKTKISMVEGDLEIADSGIKKGDIVLYEGDVIGENIELYGNIDFRAGGEIDVPAELKGEQTESEDFVYYKREMGQGSDIRLCITCDGDITIK